MHRIAGGVCAICGERVFSSQTYSSDDGVPRCGLCRRIEPPFVRAAAYGSYDGGLRELIHLLKYASVRPAANVLGRMLAEAIAELETEFGAEAVTVVPVPLHRSKFCEREFNHAAVIARAAIVIQDHFLIELSKVQTQANNSLIILTPLARRSTSSKLL